MKISSLIFEYLVEKEHVGIMGFGEFTAEGQDSYIHPIDHSFTPADKKIKFRLDKNVADDGLVAFLSDNYGWSDSESKNKIREAVIEWVKALRSGKEVVFEQLGVIKVNASKVVVFMEEERLAMDLKHFGLKGFKMEPLQTHQAASTATTTMPVQEKSSKKRTIFIWLSAAAMLLIIAGGFWFFKDNIFPPKIADNTIVKDTVSATKNRNNKQLEEEKSTTQPQEGQVDSLPKKDIVETQPMEESPIQEDTNQVMAAQGSKPVKEVTTIKELEDYENQYFVIAGCFRSSKKAETFLSDLRERGYEASIEGKTSGGLIRVCYGSYPTWRVASQVAGIISEKENTSAWVQKIIN